MGSYSETLNSRQRTLTQKGVEVYEEARDKYCLKIEGLWRTLDSTLEITSPLRNTQSIIATEDRVMELYDE